jgi:hypothetical protein
MKRFTVILFLVCEQLATKGQVIINFLPDVYARNVDGLGNFQLQNLSGQNLYGHVVIAVKENTSKQQVVNVTTPNITITPGLNSFPKPVFVKSGFQFFGSSYSDITNQTRVFPPGDYTFCFRFILYDKTDEFENCFDGRIEPLLPISLLTPNDRDSICLKRPMLSWQPPMPFRSSMRFRLLLTEKKDKTPAETVLKNAPLLLLNNIPSFSINYPANYPELQEGKTYYWQVIAYEKGLVVSTSEIWEFTVKCKEAPTVDPQDSYRELKLFVNGNYYIAKGILKFSFLNNYNIKKLSYSILDVEKGNEPVRHLPEVNLQQGLNKIDIDLTELGLSPGKNYILKVFPFNEPPVEVRFVYME